MDIFVEASQALVEPLEAFFNNVFVMAVSGFVTSCSSFSKSSMWELISVTSFDVYNDLNRAPHCTVVHAVCSVIGVFTGV